MNDTTKSILLQVAFKEASNFVDDRASMTAATMELYEVLIALHERFNIDPDEGRKNSGGYSKKSEPASSTPKPQGEVFMFNGHLIEDFRNVKSAPGSTLKPNYPDFKTVNGEVIEGVTTDRGAAWLYDMEGQPNEAVKELVAAADERPV